jgi:hypothetical protein
MKSSLNQVCGTCIFGLPHATQCNYVPPPLVRNFIHMELGADAEGIIAEGVLSKTNPHNYCTEWRSKNNMQVVKHE